MKLRQGSGKDGQWLFNKRPLKAPKRRKNLNPCLELTLNLVAPPSHHLPTASLIFSKFMAGMVKEREVGSMEGILDQCGLCYFAGMAIIEDEG